MYVAVPEDAVDGVYPEVPVDRETASHYLATFEVDAVDVPKGINVTA